MFNALNREYNRLDPCPFCGCGKVDFGFYMKNGLEIICRRCSVRRRQRTLRMSLEELEAHMVEHWNTRFPTPNNEE